MSKAKYLITTAVFVIVLFGFGITQLILPDKELSYSERRRLEQTPEISAQTVFSGEYMDNLENYLLDQFPMREQLRAVNALINKNLFFQKDIDQIYEVEGTLCKLEYPLKTDQIEYCTDKINSIYEQYLSGMDVYYSIVPDKNYFVASEHGYPSIDYDELCNMMEEGIGDNVKYIDIFDCLSIDDYYITDAHWKQDCILDVAQRLTEGMGADYSQPEYKYNTLEGFYGVYCGQSALATQPESLTYLTSSATESATVTSLEADGTLPVYTLDRFEGMDGYDIFLNGAQAFLEIECPEATTDEELIIFRDSYSSSLAPLLTSTYKKITLIDLRYMSSELLEQYVKFEDQTVLFLYSTVLLNSSSLLR